MDWLPNVWKTIENLGSSGLLVWCVYKLLDKWAGKFLDAQNAQAAAMSDLASAVKNTMGEQHEMLLAVRVLARNQEELKMLIVQHLAKGDA